MNKFDNTEITEVLDLWVDETGDNVAAACCVGSASTAGSAGTFSCPVGTAGTGGSSSTGGSRC